MNLSSRIAKIEAAHGDQAHLPTFLDEEERIQYFRDLEAQIRHDRGGHWVPNRHHQTVEQAGHWMARRKLILRRVHKEMEKQEEQKP